MTLNQLLYFREVATQQGFTKAAEKLFVAQSSLSHAIIALEDELGVSLLERKSGKKVGVTEFGYTLLEYANKILNDAEEARMAMERMRNPLGGVVKVEYSFVNCFKLIPPAILAFENSEYSKDIMIRYEINHGLRKIEWLLRDGELDIAFTCAPSFEGLKTIPIAYQHLYVMVPSVHHLAGRESLTLEDVAAEPLVVYNKGRHMHSWILKMFEHSGLSPNIIEFCDDWATQMSMVAIGKGLAVTQMLPHDEELISAIPLIHPLNPRKVYMHWSAERELTPAVRTALKFFTEYFTDKNGGKPVE